MSDCQVPGCARCLEISRIVNVKDRDMAGWAHAAYEEACREAEALNRLSREKSFRLSRQVEGMTLDPRQVPSRLCRNIDIVVCWVIALILGVLTTSLFL
jgi:hypothetical protein